MKIVLLTKQYNCFTASLKFRLLKGRYVHNGKVFRWLNFILFITVGNTYVLSIMQIDIFKISP